MPVTPRRLPRSPSSGFTLIEVLVSILVFSLGILGAVGMQAKVLQASTQNGDRGRASMLANEIAAEMWASQSISLPPANITAWQALVSTPSKGGLPNGVGTVTTGTVNGVATATINVTWLATSAASTRNQFTTTVVVP
jgi:type IV pilus assembly protein PilV